jgi:hypothetical protein
MQVAGNDVDEAEEEVDETEEVEDEEERVEDCEATMAFQVSSGTGTPPGTRMFCSS